MLYVIKILFSPPAAVSEYFFGHLSLLLFIKLCENKSF